MKNLFSGEIWLFITTFLYFAMNGAQIFETLVFVPKWAASPPTSFHILTDKDGLSLKTFWTVFHSIHEVIFILTIILCWKMDIRNWLLILFTIHFAVRIWTLLYFAPNVIEFQKIADQATLAKDLFNKVTLWRNLNYIRVSLFIGVNLGLAALCKKYLFTIIGN